MSSVNFETHPTGVQVPTEHFPALVSVVPEAHTIHGMAPYTHNVESAPIPCGIRSPSADIPKLRGPLERVVWLNTRSIRHDSNLSSLHTAILRRRVLNGKAREKGIRHSVCIVSSI